MNGQIIQTLYATVQNTNILPLTSVCNVQCVFCSHKQNPPGVKAIALPPLPLEMVEDLLNFINPRKTIIIGESASLIMEGEPFTHPQFFRCLELVRARFPQTLVQITTNGSYLDEQAVQRLTLLKPIEINLSLNTGDISGREQLMGDKRAPIACQAPLLLNKYGLNYHGSIVAMPHLTGWDRLYQTIKSLSLAGAQTIRVFKPGFTKYTSSSLGTKPEIFQKLEEKVIGWRKEFCPITLEPLLIKDLEAQVVGVIDNSPAFKGGLKTGDIITTINGSKPFSRVEAFNLLNQPGRHTITVERADKLLNLELNVLDKSGAVFDYDISRELVKELDSFVRSKEPKKIMLLASSFAYPLLFQTLSHLKNLEVIEVKNKFFGGNIGCAGLLTIEDFKHTLAPRISNNFKPDLLILPQIAFNELEKDLTGKNLRKLAEQYNCSIVLK